jgi:fructan beta-fructosidase
MDIRKTLLAGCFILAAIASQAQKTTAKLYHEPYRLQAHFSPQQMWVNDPNGMVYYKGTYHLFFQHYPKATVWGPMHWGHAVSKDLIHWKQTPIALYPDKLGYIFSGSVVVDENNTSGFGTKGKPAMVAIFTHHDPKGRSWAQQFFKTRAWPIALMRAPPGKNMQVTRCLKTPVSKIFATLSILVHTR